MPQSGCVVLVSALMSKLTPWLPGRKRFLLRGNPASFHLNYMLMQEYSGGVNLIRIYECLCDETRLRILHLLTRAPLCVCHFQSILREPQVKISKHLLYLRKHGLVESRQRQNWRIYRLPEKQSYELQRHLQCLQDCVQENPLFRADLKRLKTVAKTAAAIASQCPAPKAASRHRKAGCCS